MKRTNIVIDESLVNAALKATGIKTRRELVDYALRELLRRESQKKILELKGKVTCTPCVNYFVENRRKRFWN